MPDLDALDAETSFIWFAEETLGLNLYDWQCDAIEPLDEASEHLVKISVLTPNGSGKSSVCIPAMVLGWLAMYPQGRVVLTSADGKQLDGQAMPAINRHKGKFPQWKFIEREIRTPGPDGNLESGGFFIAFSVADGARAEGWHKLDDNDGPLLIIVDEGKTVSEDVYSALDRCTPNAVVLFSSAGTMSGRFYETQFKPELGFTTLKVGLKDCPHISQEKIDYILATHGANSPFTRSALHGEFVEFFPGSSVYYAYNAEAHEAEGLGWPNGATMVVGMDVGTMNSSVILAVWKDKAGHIHVWAMREIVLEGSDTERQCVELLRVLATEFPFWNKGAAGCPQCLFFCDPAARNSAFTARGATASAYRVMQSHGIAAGYKIGMQLQPSLSIVNRTLEQNHQVEIVNIKTQEREFKTVWHFKIDRVKCPNLVRAMRGGYRYPQRTEPGYDTDKPVKGALCDGLDHVADGFRYGLVNILDIGIEQHIPEMQARRQETVNPEKARTI